MNTYEIELYKIALQPRALVGGATFIVYRGCGLMGGSNEPNELPLDPPPAEH